MSANGQHAKRNKDTVRTYTGRRAIQVLQNHSRGDLINQHADYLIKPKNDSYHAYLELREGKEFKVVYPNLSNPRK